uniref:Uncharacterized protein n=1 Tax=Glossina brevipalpis TaxID=37001 RepID=A0A1A9WPF2_9MUSC
MSEFSGFGIEMIKGDKGIRRTLASNVVLRLQCQEVVGVVKNPLAIPTSCSYMKETYDVIKVLKLFFEQPLKKVCTWCLCSAVSIVLNLPNVGGILVCGLILISISILEFAGAVKHHQVMLFFLCIKELLTDGTLFASMSAACPNYIQIMMIKMMIPMVMWSIFIMMSIIADDYKDDVDDEDDKADKRPEVLYPTKKIKIYAELQHGTPILQFAPSIISTKTQVNMVPKQYELGFAVEGCDSLGTYKDFLGFVLPYCIDFS